MSGKYLFGNAKFGHIIVNNNALSVYIYKVKIIPFWSCGLYICVWYCSHVVGWYVTSLLKKNFLLFYLIYNLVFNLLCSPPTLMSWSTWRFLMVAMAKPSVEPTLVRTSMPEPIYTPFLTR